MPRRSSPFSTRLEGPRTPAEAAFAKASHQKRSEERARSMERLEDRPTLVDVRDYLKGRGLEKLCPTLEDCKPANVEPALLDDLRAARAANDDGRMLELRRLIWTDSKQVNANESPKRAEALAKRLLADLLRKQEGLERFDPDAAHEMEEGINGARKLIEVIRDRKYGPDAETATEMIEGLFASAIRSSQSPYEGIRKQAQRELSELRVIRDELYFLRCFPGWAKLRNSVVNDQEKSLGT